MNLQEELLLRRIDQRARASERAGITAVAIIASKALISDPTGIEVAGVKLALAKPFFLTGGLGLLLWFFILAALSAIIFEHQVMTEIGPRKIAASMAGLNPRSQFAVTAIVLVTNVLSLLFLALLGTSVFYSWPDLVSLVGFVGRNP